MESESPSIDPRYRPEFQRGFSGVTAPLPVAPATRARERVHIEPVQREPVYLEPSAGVIDVESATEAKPPIEPERSKPSRNPYFLIILLASVIAIALGAWLTLSLWIVNFSTQFTSSNSVESRFSQGISFAFSTPLITVGLASLFGLGFWLAARRRR